MCTAQVNTPCAITVDQAAMCTVVLRTLLKTSWLGYPVLEPQVDWKAPRPVREFLQPNTFLPPKSFSKWEARVKNNLYYYRSNYAVLLVLSFTCCFLRNPWALVALSITGFGILCLNDPTATALK